jgi:uncharacterized lipoprotein YddW (UPF0748 family)
MVIPMSIAALIHLAALTSPAMQTPALPPIEREFRAVWVATVANIDWPSRAGLSTQQQQAELLRILDTSAAMNINAVIFQVRPAADALYASKLEPWSEYLTGEQGKAPSPAWDPLQFAVEESHKRGMELHVWFNPYRAKHSAAKTPRHATHISRTNPSVVKQYGDFLWMDPAEPFVQQRSYDVFLDVVKRYDIDGVHIDDYFYPYKSYAGGADFPDGPSWQRYRSGGGTLERADWRREQVNIFVKRVYEGIKAEKPWVKFGISPFGIYRPGYPASVTAGFDQYSELYADARKWLVEGWCDYYTPQLYWRIGSPQSYPALLEWWVQNNPKGRHMWPGLFTSRTNPADGNWPAKEIVDQIEITRRQPGATGTVHFSMKAFLNNWANVRSTVQSGPYRTPAAVPASPWLDARAPNAPTVSARQVNGKWQLALAPNGDNDVRFYAVRWLSGNGWTPPVITSMTSVTGESGGPITHAAVMAIDRVGNQSEPTIVRL